MAKENKYGFIYITTNTLNGKKYIGQKKYLKGWEDYLGSGIALNNAIKKYGKEYFTKIIIDESENRNELNNKEIYWINFYDAVKRKDFYNIAYGGDGGNTTSKYTKEEKFLIYQKSNIGKNVGSKNAFAKQVICTNTMEVFDTIESAGIKYNIDPKGISGCCKKLDSYYTSGFHPVTKERLRWEYYDEEKDYKYIPYKRTYTYKKVKCNTTGEIFLSVSDASLKYNVTEDNIRRCCNGFLKTTNSNIKTRLIWSYFEEDKGKVIECNIKLN